MVDGTFDANIKLGKISVMGVSKFVREVYLNDREVEFNYDNEILVCLIIFLFLFFKTNKKQTNLFNLILQLLEVRGLNFNFKQNITLRWSDKVITRTTTAVPRLSGKPILNQNNYANSFEQQQPSMENQALIEVRKPNSAVSLTNTQLKIFSFTLISLIFAKYYTM